MNLVQKLKNSQENKMKYNKYSKIKITQKKIQLRENKK